MEEITRSKHYILSELSEIKAMDKNELVSRDVQNPITPWTEDRHT